MTARFKGKRSIRRRWYLSGSVLLLVGLAASACGGGEDTTPAAVLTPEVSTPQATLAPSPAATPLPTPSTAGPSGLRKIAFYSDRDGNREIYVMNADVSNQSRLTDNPPMIFLPIGEAFVQFGMAPALVPSFANSR